VLLRKRALRAGIPGALLALLLLAGPQPALGQEPAGAATFSPEEIEAIVAPVALHPDDLLAEILVAATYPLEIVEAARWRKANPDVADKALTMALEQKEWDASVKSLLQFPDVLKMMDENLEWMQKLGNAFLAQKEEVMRAVQKLRRKAQEAGNLKSTGEQNVVARDEVIVIEPADPDVIYVPVYDPWIVYGDWWYPNCRPWRCWPYPYGAGIYGFGAGIWVGACWGYAWNYCHWGSRCDVYVDVHRNAHYNRYIDRDRYGRHMEGRTGGDVRGGRGTWQHDPAHRRGVGYADRGSQQRYGRGPSASARSREVFRGWSGSTRSGLAGQAPASADRGRRTGSGATTTPADRRADGATRGGARASAGDRGGSGVWSRSTPTYRGGSATRSSSTAGRWSGSASPRSRSSGAFGGSTSRSQVQRQSSRGQSSLWSSGRSSAGRSSGWSRGSSGMWGGGGGGRSGGGRSGGGRR
jgi:hypothetical protein